MRSPSWKSSKLIFLPETQLWAETYDSENGDILSVQQRVADSVAREIRVALSPRDTTTLGDGRSVIRKLRICIFADSMP